MCGSAGERERERAEWLKKAWKWFIKWNPPDRNTLSNRDFTTISLNLTRFYQESNPVSICTDLFFFSSTFPCSSQYNWEIKRVLIKCKSPRSPNWIGEKLSNNTFSIELDYMLTNYCYCNIIHNIHTIMQSNWGPPCVSDIYKFFANRNIWVFIL